MAAKPKMTPEQWSDTRTAWEADPRKALPWLIQELGLPVSAEALRLRAKAEGWAKLGVDGGAKLAPEPKLAELPKPKLAPEKPSLDDGAQIDGEDLPTAPVVLQKVEHESGSTLTPREERFVQEYLIDLNATQAYLRANPDSTDASANTLGPRLLVKVRIAEAIKKAQAERAERAGLNADEALLRVWHMAAADARELVQIEKGCCRHCHGEGYGRQRTIGEMNRDKEKWAVKGKDLADFDEEGGIGFDPRKKPSPECPDCCGNGLARVVLADTRNLSPAAVALYAGAKEGKYGIEMQLHDQRGALDMVFRHLGLYKKDNEQQAGAFASMEVLRVFAERMAASRIRQQAVLDERRTLGMDGD